VCVFEIVFVLYALDGADRDRAKSAARARKFGADPEEQGGSFGDERLELEINAVSYPPDYVIPDTAAEAAAQAKKNE
jgi:hypothetical protein